MNKIFGWSIAVVVIAIVIVLIAVFGSSNKEQDVIKIGFLAPISGDLAMYGLSSKAAVELAAEKANYEIDGKKVEFVYEDGKCNGQDATSAVNKLINVDDVKYIFGGFCSSETLAAAPVAESNKVLMLSMASSSPQLKTAGDYIFTLYPLDDFEGSYGAEIAYNKLGAKNVALLIAQSDWPKGLEGAFKSKFEELGGKIVITEYNEQNAKDLSMQLTKIKATNPDLIYTVQYVEAMTNLITQMQASGIEIPTLSPTIWEESLITSVGKEAAEGHYATKFDAPVAYENWDTKLKEKSGLTDVEGSMFSPRAYDAFFMLKAAIESVGEDTTKIKDYLLENDYKGITGEYVFDEFGSNINAGFKLQKVLDGKLVDQPQ